MNEVCTPVTARRVKRIECWAILKTVIVILVLLVSIYQTRQLAGLYEGNKAVLEAQLENAQLQREAIEDYRKCVKSLQRIEEKLND